MTYQFEDVNYALRALASLLQHSVYHESRAGQTKEKRHVHFEIEKPLAREILLPSRKANIAAQIAETAWVLAGRSDIEWLSHYLPRAKDFSDDGKTWRAGYGPRLRAWGDRPWFEDRENETVDQLAEVIAILNKDPNSRRAVISLWDPAVDTAAGKDIACNNWLCFSKRADVLDLDVSIRSNDLIWGWSGINQFEWSVLLEIVAAATGSTVGSIHYNVASLHVYERHFKRLDLLAAERYEHQPSSPRFQFQSEMDPVEELDDALAAFFELEAVIRQGEDVGIDVDDFPEPMLRSWLRVLQWWWSGDASFINPLQGTALYRACIVSMQPTGSASESAHRTRLDDLGRELINGQRAEDVREALRGFKAPRVSEVPEKDLAAFQNVLERFKEASPFARSVIDLHREKNAAYGDSWMKRGELFSVLPNIARKVDRIGAGETKDETSADTAIDLLVYLAKYATFLACAIKTGAVDGARDIVGANQVIIEQDRRILPEEQWEKNMIESGHVREDTLQRIDMIRDRFDRLLKHAEESRGLYEDRLKIVDDMLPQAYILAKRFWTSEQQEI